MRFSKFSILSMGLLASAVFSSFVHAVSPPKPSDIQLSKQLWDIRDNIIEHSFKQLPVGAWAKYMTKNTDGSITYTEVAYFGKEKGIHEDEDLYVGESSQEGSTIQIWYRIKETDKFLGGKKRIYYFDIETQEAYILQSDGKIFYGTNKDVELLMKMKGQFLSYFVPLPLASADTVKVTDVGYTTVSSGKTVQGKKIISLTNGSERIVSDNVPFGLCQENNNMFLYDFGWKGAKRRISRGMASRAIHLTNFLFPGITSGKAPSSIKDFLRKKW